MTFCIGLSQEKATMSSRNSLKEKKVIDNQQDQKKENAVKLRRKESNTKTSQVETQRKSVFRFLHRDKKKGPELPEHGFIPDARRVLESSSKSLTLSQSFSPDPRNRWSSYEPLDFGKLSTCMTENSSKDLQSTFASIDDETPNNRSVSHDQETSPTESLSSRDILFEGSFKNGKFRSFSGTDIILEEKLKHIDERLEAALSERRRILQSLLTIPDSFPGHLGLQTLLLDSFLSSETLTKLASHSINLPGNAVTSEDMTLFTHTVLELRKSLTMILEMLCSNIRDKIDLQPSSPYLFSLTENCVLPQGQVGTFSIDTSFTKCWKPDVFFNTGVVCSWSDTFMENVDGSVDAELEEVLSKIDEENEDSSTIDRNSPSHPPSIPLDTHPLKHGPPLTFPQNELDFQRTDSLGPTFIKDIRKSFSTSCFPDLKIHSSIAEEDEELFDDSDLENGPNNIEGEGVSLLAVGFGKSGSDSLFSDSEIIMSMNPVGHVDRVNQLNSFVGDENIAEEDNINLCEVLNESLGIHGLCGDSRVEAAIDEGMIEAGACMKRVVCDNNILECDEDAEICKNIELTKGDLINTNLINKSEQSVLVEAVGLEDFCGEMLHKEDRHVVLPVPSCDNPQQITGDLEREETACCDNNGVQEHTNSQLKSHDVTLDMSLEDKQSTDSCNFSYESQKTEIIVTLNEPLYEVEGNVTLESSASIFEAPKVELVDVLDVNGADEELKIESVEVMVCSEEILDSTGDNNDDISDQSTPVNSDTCESHQEISQGIEKIAEDEGRSGDMVDLKVNEVSVPIKAGYNKNKKKNKRRRGNQQKSQQTDNAEKTFSNSGSPKELCGLDSMPSKTSLR